MYSTMAGRFSNVISFISLSESKRGICENSFILQNKYNLKTSNKCIVILNQFQVLVLAVSPQD